VRKASVEGREEGERGGRVCVTGKIDEEALSVTSAKVGRMVAAHLRSGERRVDRSPQGAKG
jgi:hypothetical protein